MGIAILLPKLTLFQSTPSARRATILILFFSFCWRYFNPRPPRGGRQLVRQADALSEKISIHALREEGDALQAGRLPPGYNFNPRPPRGERPTQHRHGARCRVFQSTPSARRATQYVWAKNKEGKISIHALREESDVLLFQQILLQGYFNPRPPRGGRHRQSCRVCITTLFQSTPSARRATPCGLVSVVPLVYFNPRPPRGGRPTKHISTKCPT